METSGGGIGKMFSRAMSGENMFQNRYTAQNTQGSIAFASSFPGDIIVKEIRPGQEVICQKSAFLAASTGVELSIFFQKKVGSGFFGGEGFIMQKLSGNGIAFLEIDGSVVTKQLQPTCSMDIVSVKGLKNKFLGGEGFFNTVVTGPGQVSLQTMPASQVAGVLRPFLPSGN